MHQLITPILLEKYLVKERTIKGTRYEAIFEYSGIPVTDFSGEEIAHEVIVGFRNDTGEVYTGSIYLPIALDNGLLTKNKTTWHAVHMVIPPLAFYGPTGKTVSYINELISSRMDASALDDFFPEIYTMRVGEKTPLVRELATDEPRDVHDLNNWIAIGIEHAIIELFNQKIVGDMQRSERGGYKGISASIRALHTLCRAFCRFNEDEEDIPVSSDDFSVIPEEMTMLGSVHIIDKIDTVILHSLVKQIAIREDSPIDVCSCSQSYPIRTGRLKDGVRIEEARFVGEKLFPYTRWRRSIVGITSDDPRRVIVSRSISRALRLDEPNEPYAVTDVLLGIDSLSLPGIRMTHPLTHEDGMVVSESFARKAGAYKVCVEKVSVPLSAEVQLMKAAYTGNDARDLIKRIARSRDDGHFRDDPMVVNRGDILFVLLYTDVGNTVVTKEIRTSIKTSGIITRIETFIPATDLDEATITYRFVFLVYYPLEVGDKIADAHGNKATVSAIWPDILMPRWESPDGREERIQYIAAPFVHKRLAVGAEIEDKCALVNYMREKNAFAHGDSDYEMDVIDSLTAFTLSDADTWLADAGLSYTGSVTIGTRVCHAVPLSLRRLFRLDNNARDALNTRYDVAMNEYGRTSINARMGIDIITMLTRGATTLVHTLIEKSGASTYLFKSVAPILHAMSGSIPEGTPAFEIRTKLDRELLGNPYSMDIFSRVNRENTVCDPRIMQGHYGYFILPDKKMLVVPPHEALADLGNGTVKVSRLAVSANRVLAEKLSYNRGYRDKTNIPREVERYRALLGSIIAGKNGVLRDALLPVFPTTIRAVATSYMSDDPLEICIPESEMHRLMRLHPEFRNVYHTTDNWYCIMKRDPVHREQNIITVRFKLWKHKTIGISPLLIGCMDGDFDGDTLFALFPTDSYSLADAKKLIPRFRDIYEPTKHLADTDGSNALSALRERIGETSTFRNPHPCDVVKNPELLEKLLQGITSDQLSRECIKAARDFEIIKDGTAHSGAIGLSFIYTIKPEQKQLLSQAMQLYHALAQNTLNAKAGSPVPALIILEAMRTGNEERINQSLDELDFRDPECRAEFIRFARTIRESGGRLKFLTEEFPIVASIQKGAGYVQALSVAERYIERRSMGEGIWEALADYLIYEAKESVYAKASKHDLFAQKIRDYTETPMREQTYSG